MSSDIYNLAERYFGDNSSIWATKDGNFFQNINDAKSHSLKTGIEFFEVLKKTNKEKEK